MSETESAPVRAITNVHERIGWFNCANLRCRRELGNDYVTLVTTAHVRRFCSVYCIADGLEAWMEHLAAVPNGPEREDVRAEAAEWSQRVFESIPPAESPCTKCRTPVSPNKRLCPGCVHSTTDEMMRRTFAEQELRRLPTLPPCGRCEAVGVDGQTKCEKCLNAGWEIGAPVTCGCGCWTRWPLEIECGLSTAPQPGEM